MSDQLSKLDEKEQKKRRLALQGKYSQRITIAKHGREMYLSKDYVGATQKYHEYLSILAETQQVDDIYQLSPAKFDPKSDMTEMLLISHIYWELSKVYEMTPKLQKAFEKCLKQFVRFTINQPYQVLNSEVLRKYIKKNKQKSRQIGALEAAYSQIQVGSKKCFVASFAFGENHWVTTSLRRFKTNWLSGSRGAKTVGLYYRISSPLVSWLELRPMAAFFAKLFSRPVLAVLALMGLLERKSQ